jgi:hypothetical protein
MPVILAFERLRQEDQEFKDSLGYIEKILMSPYWSAHLSS